MSGPSTGQGAPAPFDAFASDYHAALERGLSLSGEDADHFARSRVDYLAQRIDALAYQPATVLDFGCGVGSTIRFLCELPSRPRVIGTDASASSLEVARSRCRDLPSEFVPLTTPLEESVDVAYCNGVFHHIEPPERPAALAYVWKALRPGGLFAFWENNPWNPGTKLVMRRIPFDRDAQTLSARRARALLVAAGFELIDTQHWFIFPNSLRALRRLERPLARFPIGAQYMVLARRP